MLDRLENAGEARTPRKSLKLEKILTADWFAASQAGFCQNWRRPLSLPSHQPAKDSALIIIGSLLSTARGHSSHPSFLTRNRKLWQEQRTGCGGTVGGLYCYCQKWRPLLSACALAPLRIFLNLPLPGSHFHLICQQSTLTKVTCSCVKSLIMQTERSKKTNRRKNE